MPLQGFSKVFYKCDGEGYYTGLVYKPRLLDFGFPVVWRTVGCHTETEATVLKWPVTNLNANLILTV